MILFEEGKWIREKLLAGSVMDVPVNVDARIPDDEHQTLRQRFGVVKEESCWRCHKKMNPLGMPFEAYNHVGRWRATEKGKPVDTTGVIDLLDHSSPTQQVSGVRLDDGSILDLHCSSELFDMFFAYFMGRNEMLSDSKTLIEMDKACVESGGSF